MIIMDKSSLISSQIVTFLGAQDRFADIPGFADSLGDRKFFSIVEEFLSSREQSARFWGDSVGSPGLYDPSHSRRSSSNESSSVGSQEGLGLRGRGGSCCWDDPSREDLLWWCVEGLLKGSVSFIQSFSGLNFWSDASDVGWGVNLVDQFVSGVWLEEEALLPINRRELLAMGKGLKDVFD